MGNRRFSRGSRGEPWETWFWFSTVPRASRASCGNVEISRRWRDFQGAVGKVENLLLVFHAFHRSVISTAFSGLDHRPRRHWRSSASLAFCIRAAASVSLMRRASRSSIAAVIPSFRCFCQSGSETSFSYGVR